MTVLHTIVNADDVLKPDLVLVHGWGAHSGIWQTVLPVLQQTFRVTCIDLPGHGHSQELIDNSLDGWAGAALEVAPEKAIWLGWSLGGLVAQRVAAMASERVEKLILVASTPKFVATQEWPKAVDEKVFSAFHAEVVKEPRASLLRFIALQTRGSKTASEDSRVLRKTLLQPEPKAAALDAGMQLLLTTDLRKQAVEIICPVLVLGGKRDTLIPYVGLSKISELFSNSEFNFIPQAGHAPFLSHPDEFHKLLSDFCFKNIAEEYKEAK